MSAPKYIFQLTADNIAKMLAAGNACAGRGIKITPLDGAIEIAIDEDVITDIIWCFVRSGQVKEGLSGAACVVANNIKNTRQCYVTDPAYYT